MPAASKACHGRGSTHGPSAYRLSSVGIHPIQLNQVYQQLGLWRYVDARNKPEQARAWRGITSERLFSSGSSALPGAGKIEFGVGGADVGFGEAQFAAHDVGAFDQRDAFVIGN